MRKKWLVCGRLMSLFVGSLIAAPFASASDYGTTGLIDVPTARMQQDGYLTVGAAFDGLHQSYYATYQAFPWLEATFRYTGFEDFFYWDRNYAIKARLLEETDYLPQLAIGARDLVGTGVFGSEYVVGSKRFGGLDITLGVGWGRLAGDELFDNPLVLIDERFETRPQAQGLEDTGQLRAIFFRGPKIGLFGGASYQFDNYPLKLVAEYNPDQYDFNNRGNRPNYDPTTPLSYGIEWNPIPGVHLALTHQHGDEVGISIRSVLDTKALPPAREKPSFISACLPQERLPSQIDKNKWYDRLLYDVERSGLILVEGDISSDGKSAEIVVGNASYSLWSDALSQHVALADLHLPASVETLYFVTEEAGHRSATLILPGHQHSEQILKATRARVVGGRTLENPSYQTGFVTGNVVSDISLSTRFQLFDPDDPARYQVYLNMSSEYVLDNHWSIEAIAGYRE